jgi:hypothetical protein
MKNDEDKAADSIAKIYHTSTGEETEQISTYLKSTIQKETSRVTFCEAFCTNEKYRTCSWVNIANIIFHELVGINVIMIYSNTILSDILSPDSSFTPRLGTICVGGANFLSAILSIWSIKWYGRRDLLLWGHSGMTFAHVLIGVLIIYNYDYGVLGGISLFLFFY